MSVSGETAGVAEAEREGTGEHTNPATYDLATSGLRPADGEIMEGQCMGRGIAEGEGGE